jgi:ABC-type Na+ efflux pump permease subunit
MIPALPLAFVNMLELQRSLPLMAVPSLSQHFLMTSVLRGESPALAEVVMSAGVSLALGALLSWVAGRLYEREAILG